MKKYNCVLAIICSIAITGFCYANMGVSLPQVDNPDVPLNTPTTVTISALDAVDPCLMPSSQRLVRCDPAANVVLSTSPMFDDGNNGDAMQGDNRFTSRVTLDINNPGLIEYRATAAYSKVRDRSMSDVIELSAFRPLTDADFNAAENVLSSAKALFDSLCQSMPREQAAQQTRDAVRLDPYVAGADIYGNCVLIGLTSGMFELLIIDDSNNIDGSSSSSLVIKQLLVPALLTDPTETNGEKTPRNSKVMLWAPFSTAEGWNQRSLWARERFKNAAWFTTDPTTPEILEDSDASLESVRDFGSYGVICLESHGGWVGPKTPGWWQGSPLFGGVVIFSGTRVNPDTRKSFSTEIAQCRVGPTSFGDFVFTPWFIRRWVKDMPDTFIYAGDCYSLKDESMWKAFEEKGAKIYFGWDNKVYRNNDIDTFIALLDPMLPLSLDQEPVTAQVAYDNLPTKTFSYEHQNGDIETTNFEMKAYSPEWYYMKLITDPNFALIPGGAFLMGDSFNELSNALPVHTVILDSFYMGRCDITNAQYCEFLNSALSEGLITAPRTSGGNVYGTGQWAGYWYFCDYGSDIYLWSGIYFDVLNNKFVVRNKSVTNRSLSNDPVVAVSWLGAVMYCNWRSQKEGKNLFYTFYSDNPDIIFSENWSANGYRLPTEAEWEYAARGGLLGQRYPWGNTINHSKANYQSSGDVTYDLGPDGYDPIWSSDAEVPYTSPVRRFPPNEYGLYDMAGNVRQWCEDGYGPYSPDTQINPKGPLEGYPLVRGGSYFDLAEYSRVDNRIDSSTYLSEFNWTGFRIARKAE